MKAIVCTKYGPPGLLRLEEVAKPAPGDSEVLVGVYASSVCWANLALVRGKPFVTRLMAGGLLKPGYRIPGGDIAGRVEAVGRNVKQFKPGDEVYGDMGDSGFGAFAEYICVPEKTIARKPANVSFEEAAAACQAAVVALQGLRDMGKVRPGQKVLIYGASGGIGTFAVQLARHFGAEVTGVCSTRNLDMVRSIGADHVVDYTKEDFSRNGRHYDLILATAGYRSIFDYRRALSPNGTYVAIGGAMAQVFQPIFLGPLLSTGGKKLSTLSHKINQSDLVFIKGLLEAGKIKSVIDRRYTLSEVPEALEYFGGGHARGKVVITVKKWQN